MFPKCNFFTVAVLTFHYNKIMVLNKVTIYSCIYITYVITWYLLSFLNLSKYKLKKILSPHLGIPE